MISSLLFLTLAGAPSPQMHISVAKLAASEQKPAVGKVMAAQLEALKGCYDLALKDSPQLKGQLSLTFSLEPRQSTPDALTLDEASSLQDGTVSSCVMARLRATEWPKPKKHSQVAVTLDFSVR
jgi:hypothetical protein